MGSAAQVPAHGVRKRRSLTPQWVSRLRRVVHRRPGVLRLCAARPRGLARRGGPVDQARSLQYTCRGKGNTMSYTTQPLACDPTKLKGFSERLIVSHYENNYSGAVRRLNAITAQLASLDVTTAPVFVLNGLKREELIATNSMILHELYFDNLGGDGVSGGAIEEALKRDFGSVDRWRAEFVGTGKALRGGAGWVLLSSSHRDRRLMNQWAADHTHALAGGTPILALDMYEHSYQLDYGASAERYVDAFMDNLNWAHVTRLLEAHAPRYRESEFEAWRAGR